MDNVYTQEWCYMIYRYDNDVAYTQQWWIMMDVRQIYIKENMNIIEYTYPSSKYDIDIAMYGG